MRALAGESSAQPAARSAAHLTLLADDGDARRVRRRKLARVEARLAPAACVRACARSIELISSDSGQSVGQHAHVMLMAAAPLGDSCRNDTLSNAISPAFIARHSADCPTIVTVLPMLEQLRACVRE